ESVPITEDFSLGPLNPYAGSKLIAENILDYYWRHFKVESNIFRFFNVYGIGQAENFLIPEIVRQFLSGTVVKVRDTEPKRDYVHVKDVVNAMILGIDKFQGFNQYNVGSGKSYSVKEVLDLLFEVGGKELEIQEAEQKRKAEIMDTKADISKIRKNLNWSPTIGLRAGLKEMIQYYSQDL
ncbi:GDP-mannose 4,6-dehydratase, partial [Crocinitomix catalasitica]|nr:GDP-mannose 4,6-dehydratase [Crocinitomix catalasitica]